MWNPRFRDIQSLRLISVVLWKTLKLTQQFISAEFAIFPGRVTGDNNATQYFLILISETRMCFYSKANIVYIK